jgi:hypothetical protein
MPRHVARLVVPLIADFFTYVTCSVPRHVAWLVVDYFASPRLVINYFAYAARPGASARRAAHLAARRRLLRVS